MQVTVYTGDGRAEKLNNGWRDNSKNSNSRKPLILPNWNSTGKKCSFTKVQEARGSPGRKPLWDCLVGVGATEEMPETLPYAEREGEKYPEKHGSPRVNLLESRAEQQRVRASPGRESHVDVCGREFRIKSCCVWTLCLQCQG